MVRAKTIRIEIDPIYPDPRNHPADELLKILDDIERYLKRNASKILIKDMKGTTKNWSSAPTFISEYSEPFGSRMQIWVHPSGRGTLKWSRVSKGTRPRTITPKRGTTMAFKRGYKPKTTAGGSYGGPGLRYGSTIFKKQIFNHSIEPREFSAKIIDRREEKFNKDINKIIRKHTR